MYDSVTLFGIELCELCQSWSRHFSIYWHQLDWANGSCRTGYTSCQKCPAALCLNSFFSYIVLEASVAQTQMYQPTAPSLSSVVSTEQLSHAVFKTLIRFWQNWEMRHFIYYYKSYWHDIITIFMLNILLSSSLYFLLTFFACSSRLSVRVCGWSSVVSISVPWSVHTHVPIMVPSLDIPRLPVG